MIGVIEKLDRNKKDDGLESRLEVIRISPKTIESLSEESMTTFCKMVTKSEVRCIITNTCNNFSMYTVSCIYQIFMNS